VVLAGIQFAVENWPELCPRRMVVPSGLVGNATDAQCMAEECLDGSSFWRINSSRHGIVSELSFGRQLLKKRINECVGSWEECLRVRMLVVLGASTKAIGDRGKKPFVLIVFIRDRRRLRRELLTKCNELLPTLRPLAWW